jgi:uncharacterized membrane protein
MARDDQAAASPTPGVTEAEVVADADVEVVDDLPVGGAGPLARRSAPASRSGPAGPGPLRVGVAALHPLLVTVPIGAFVCALAFDLASVWVEPYVYARGAMWLVIIGLVAALVAGVVGVLDSRRRVRPGSVEGKLATRHLLLNGVALVAFAVGLWIRRTNLDTFLTDGTPVAAVVLSLVGVLFLAASALAGGTVAAALDRAESAHR